MESSGAPEPRKRDRARQWTLIGLGVLVAIFALLNLDDVKVDFIVKTTRAPLIVVVAAVFAAGIVVGMFASRRRAD